jgi:hypothetical protein
MINIFYYVITQIFMNFQGFIKICLNLNFMKGVQTGIKFKSLLTRNKYGLYLH